MILDVFCVSQCNLRFNHRDAGCSSDSERHPACGAGNNVMSTRLEQETLARPSCSERVSSTKLLRFASGEAPREAPKGELDASCLTCRFAGLIHSDTVCFWRKAPAEHRALHSDGRVTSMVHGKGCRKFPWLRLLRPCHFTQKHIDQCSQDQKDPLLGGAGEALFLGIV